MSPEKPCRHCHGPHDVDRHARQKREHEANRQCEHCESDDRQKHLTWAKGRALAFLPHDWKQALDSMVVDLRKHPAWHDDVTLALIEYAYATVRDARSCREWIDGWKG